MEADSFDYDVLIDAVKLIRNVPGMLCEIGTRRGGSTAYIIGTLVGNRDPGRTLVCIDPYGNIAYEDTDKNLVRNDYTNDMRNETWASLFELIRGRNVNLLFFNLDDTEFFKRYADGVPVYSEVKTILTDYALVFFDGPHGVCPLNVEIDFFADRVRPGGMFVFDDIGNYPHAVIESRLLGMGFSLVRKATRKASYVKAPPTGNLP